MEQLKPFDELLVQGRVQGMVQGRVKNPANYPRFVDKRITPTPLSTLSEVNNIHNKEFCYAHLLALLPLSALIHVYRY